LFAWVVAIFLPSGLIALFDLSAAAAGRNFLSATFEVADQVAPAAKLSFVILFAALLLIAHRLRRQLDLASAILAACLAMLLTLALLPATYSRGFGIGLANSRFDPALLAIYLASAVLAGLTFSSAETKCRSRIAAGSSKLSA
jgi:cell division protein FtsW (lipid II flippase)